VCVGLCWCMSVCVGLWQLVWVALCWCVLICVGVMLVCKCWFVLLFVGVCWWEWVIVCKGVCVSLCQF